MVSMVLREWIQSLSLVQPLADTLVTSAFLSILFDDTDDSVRLEELRHIVSHEDLSIKFGSILAACAWEVVDSVFEKCGNAKYFSQTFGYLLSQIHQQMKQKEWEIIIFEKVYSVNTKVELQVLLHCFELLWRSASMRTKYRVMNVIKDRFLNRSSDSNNFSDSLERSMVVEEVVFFLQRITHNRMPSIPTSKALHPEQICSEELFSLFHFVSHLFDSIVSFLPAPTAIPSMTSLVTFVRQLCHESYFTIFEHLLSIPYHALDMLLKRRDFNSKASSAISLQNLHSGDTVLLSAEVIHSIESHFPFPLPWKEVLEIYTEANASISNDAAVEDFPLSLNIPGLASLIISMFVLPTIDIPSVFQKSYSRELLFASLTVLAVDNDSRGEVKAHLFISGFQQAFTTFGVPVISLANCLDTVATKDIVFLNLAMANLGNYQATLQSHPQKAYSYFLVAARTINHWLLSQRLLDLLAHSKDEIIRKATYIAFRGYLGQFEEYSRIQVLFGLFENCPHMHIKVLLMDTTKDFVQIAATTIMNAAVTNYHLVPPLVVGSDLVDAVKDIVRGSSASLPSKICDHSMLKLAAISSYYEKESPKLSRCLQEQQGQYCCASEKPSIFWSPWMLWKVWLESFSQFFLLSATADDLPESVDICISRCNLLAFVAMKLVSSVTLRQHFLSCSIPDALHPQKVLCEVFVTLIHFQQNKLPELIEAVRRECGHDALLTMKVQVLCSVIEFTESKLLECVSTILQEL